MAWRLNIVLAVLAAWAAAAGAVPVAGSASVAGSATADDSVPVATEPELGAARINTPDPAGLPAVKIQDLHYGDVLFHFYARDHFEALVRLSAYREQRHLNPHARDAELLRGGLYLSLGQHREAREIFERLLADATTPAPVRDRAWFYLGKVLYATGHFDQSERALRAVSGGLPIELESERRLLIAQGLMYRGQFDAAIAELDGWQGPDNWTAYGRFNLGVALVRANRAERGHAMLEQVGLLQTTDPLNSVHCATRPIWRSDTPCFRQDSRSRRALRSTGSASKGHRQTRPCWGQAGPTLPAVTTSRRWCPGWNCTGATCSMPRSRSPTSRFPMPTRNSRQSARRSGTTNRRSRPTTPSASASTESIAAIRAGRLLTAALAADRGAQPDWFAQLTVLPDAPESRYLYHLLAGHEFQEGLKSYRSLESMAQNLDGWSTSLGAFSDMLETRRSAFAGKLPEADRRLAMVDVADINRRRDELRARLEAALRRSRHHRARDRC